MKVSKHLALLIALGAALAGCGSSRQPDLETEWTGHSYQDLQKSFGDPIMDMPEGYLRLVVFTKMVPMRDPADPIVYLMTPATGDSLGVSMPQAYRTQVNESQLYEQQSSSGWIRRERWSGPRLTPHEDGLHPEGRIAYELPRLDGVS